MQNLHQRRLEYFFLMSIMLITPLTCAVIERRERTPAPLPLISADLSKAITLLRVIKPLVIQQQDVVCLKPQNASPAVQKTKRVTFYDTPDAFWCGSSVSAVLQ